MISGTNDAGRQGGGKDLQGLKSSIPESRVLVVLQVGINQLNGSDIRPKDLLAESVRCFAGADIGIVESSADAIDSNVDPGHVTRGRDRVAAGVTIGPGDL